VHDKETKAKKETLIVANWVFAQTTYVVVFKSNFAQQVVFGVVL